MFTDGRMHPYHREILLAQGILLFDTDDTDEFDKNGRNPERQIHAYMYRGGESTKKQNNRKSSVSSVTLAYIQPEIPARVAKKLIRMFVAESVSLREKS